MSTDRPHLAALANKFCAWKAMSAPATVQAINNQETTTMTKAAAVKKTKNLKAKANTANKSRAAASLATGRKGQVIAMLKRPSGATTEDICKSTGMLPHSARALISGIAKTERVATTKASREDPTVYKIG